MSINLSFDTNGNLQPYEVIDVTLEEVWHLLVNPFRESTSRQLLWQHYIAYNQKLRQVLNAEWTQWLDGSFVTAKENPNDIDLINLIPNPDRYMGMVFLPNCAGLRRHKPNRILTLIFCPFPQRRISVSAKRKET